MKKMTSGVARIFQRWGGGGGHSDGAKRGREICDKLCIIIAFFCCFNSAIPYLFLLSDQRRGGGGMAPCATLASPVKMTAISE